MTTTPLVGVNFDDVIEKDYVVGIQPNYIKKTGAIGKGVMFMNIKYHSFILGIWILA